MRIFNYLLFVLIASASFAQSSDSVNYSNRSILKWSPFHLAGFYPSIQLAYEYQFHKNHSIQLDAGYVLDIEGNSDLYKNKRGVKLKTEWRYYLETNSRRRILYLALEPYANIINFDRNEFKTECFDVECTVLFTREYNYKVRYRETGVSFKLGTQLQAKRFTFDFSHGLMFRNINYNKPVIPRGIDDVDQFGWVFTPNEKKRVVFGPVVGIRIGYLLRK